MLYCDNSINDINNDSCNFYDNNANITIDNVNIKHTQLWQWWCDVEQNDDEDSDVEVNIEGCDNVVNNCDDNNKTNIDNNFGNNIAIINH